MLRVDIVVVVVDVVSNAVPINGDFIRDTREVLAVILNCKKLQFKDTKTNFILLS